MAITVVWEHVMTQEMSISWSEPRTVEGCHFDSEVIPVTRDCHPFDNAHGRRRSFLAPRNDSQGKAPHQTDTCIASAMSAREWVLMWGLVPDQM